MINTATIQGNQMVFRIYQAVVTSRMTNEEQLKTQSAEMINTLLKEFLSRPQAEIRFDFEDNQQWAVISMNLYDEDKEIAIRAYTADKYDLYLGYYDDEDEFFELLQPMTDNEKELLPKTLRKAMAKVLSDEEGLRMPGNLLAR